MFSVFAKVINAESLFTTTVPEPNNPSVNVIGTPPKSYCVSFSPLNLRTFVSYFKYKPTDAKPLFPLISTSIIICSPTIIAVGIFVKVMIVSLAKAVIAKEDAIIINAIHIERIFFILISLQCYQLFLSEIR